MPNARSHLNRRVFVHLFLVGAGWVSGCAHAQAPGPDEFVNELSSQVIDSIKSDRAIQAGDVQKVLALVDTKIMPHVDSQRMTSSAIGRFWRDASPEQQQRLQEQFKLLVVRTYAGALAQVKDQTVHLKPLRATAGDSEVVVKTEVRGRGDPIQLDYRLERTAEGWKIYDVNVLGVWLTENYRNTFAQEIGAGGIDGLIAKLTEKNKSAGRK
jgi:phospholipid transport system substrate-binding protein